jgi:endoglucanase
MVTGYTGEGGLRFETIGGINANVLPGLSVVVGKDKLPGVIGLEAVHLAKGHSTDAPAISSLAIDIGARNKDEAEGLAPLGTAAAFTTQSCDLGNSITGKAFDDRAGCAILISLLQGKRFPFDLYGVFTVQEEVGLRGARVAAYAVEPDVGIALEGTLADDMPKEEKDVSPTTQLEKGAAITVKDRSYTTPPRLLRHFVETATAENIPYQIKQPGISSTEASALQVARSGVPSITISVPCRYIHSPKSLLRRSDLEHTAQLVSAALERMTPAILEIQ